MPYSEAAANHAVTFFSDVLVHTKGQWANEPFVLEPWQEDDIIRPLFGTLNDDGTRQYRTAFIFLPRKNGKSELGAGIALYLLAADEEPGAEIYGAAGDKDQATIVYAVADEMVRRAPPLLEVIKRQVAIKRMYLYNDPASFYKAIPADDAGAHGFNGHGIIFDELHTQPNRNLYDVLRTSTGTRRQPLVVMITTAGFDQESICYEQYAYAKRILKGEIDDPTFFAYIREAEQEDDWRDEAVWHKANPALRTFRNIAEMRQMAREAEQAPAKENTFRRLYLNQWTSQETRWMPMTAWDACNGEVDASALVGRRCFLGLDLASTTDIAALVAVFPDERGGYDVLPWFWIPSLSMRERIARDHVPYDVWARMGFVEPTPGNVIDYDRIRARLDECLTRYQVAQIGYDPWNATQFIQPYADSLPSDVCVPMRQGYQTLSEPTKEVLNLALDGKLRHGGHPVLRWMADNVVVKTDENENIRPIKPRASQRIDGIVALIMALGRAMVDEGPSVYETRPLLVL